MPKKSKQNSAELVGEREIATEDGDVEAEKISLKPKAENSTPKIEKSDEQWEKVDSIFNAAKEAYQSKSSDFDSILEGLIETLQNLRNEESERNGLGGLGVGGPEMDIPEEAKTEEK